MSNLEGAIQPHVYHASIQRRITSVLICVGIASFAVVIPWVPHLALYLLALLEYLVITLLIIGNVSVVTSTQGIKVRNFLREYTIPWSSIVRFEGFPAFAVLTDGKRIPLYAIRPTVRGDFTPVTRIFAELEQCRLARVGYSVYWGSAAVKSRFVRFDVWEWLVIAIPLVWALVLLVQGL